MAGKKKASEQPSVVHPKEDLTAKSQKELAEAVRNTFAGRDGQITYNMMKRMGRYDRTCFVPQNPYATAFLLGMREFFLKIKHYNEADPSSFDMTSDKSDDVSLADATAALPPWLQEDTE